MLKEWILNKLAGPAIPILKQIIIVLDIVLAKINHVLDTLKGLGVTIDGTVLNTINNITSAVSVVRVAVAKILAFLGEQVDVVPQGNLAEANIDDEIEKLKKMI